MYGEIKYVAWFHKGGKCGCFILINKLHSRVQSALHAIWLYVQFGSDGHQRSVSSWQIWLSIFILLSSFLLKRTKNELKWVPIFIRFTQSDNVHFKTRFGAWLLLRQSKFKSRWSLFSENLSFKRTDIMGGGCGSVGRTVASNARGPRFESSHRRNFIMNVFTVNCWKTKKRPGMAHFMKKEQK